MHIQDVLSRDAIPSIDEPWFDTEYFGERDDEVIVVESDPPRAYPVRILSYHEIVNDVLETTPPPNGTGESEESADGERPIAVTWCPICASAVVYDRRVDDRVVTFGTSGKLADDALVMYDRETESEWKQPLGRAISGLLDGRELAVVPASMMTWGTFRSTYPDGVVLQPVHGGNSDPHDRSPRDVYEMAPYDEYDDSPIFGLRGMRGEGPKRSWDRDDIDAKTPVLGIVHGDDAVGYPVPVVDSEGGVVTDSVGGLDVVVVRSAAGIHAFEDPGSAVEKRDGVLYADGVEWDPTTGGSTDGRRLKRVPTRRLYAFAWQDDHGPDSFYGL